MKDNYREALTEVNEILNYLPKEYIQRLPLNLYQFIQENKSEDYVFEYNEDISLEEQDLKLETKSLIAILLLKYWNRQNRDELIQIYAQNEKSFQEEWHQKYNSDIFEKQNIIDERVPKETAMIVYQKQNIFTKIFKNVCDFIKKHLAK